MIYGREIAPLDAPIRQACHPDTLCRICTRILDTGCALRTKKQILDGYVVVVRCDNYRGMT